MQSVAKLVTGRLARLADDLSEHMEGAPLTKEEREAISEAERLAELYADVVPETTTVSGNNLFRVTVIQSEKNA